MKHLQYMGWLILEIRVESVQNMGWNVWTSKRWYVLISWVDMSSGWNVCKPFTVSQMCLREEMFPRGSSRSKSECVSLKYCFTSAWLLSSFPDFSAPTRVFVNVYWFTTYAGLFFAFFHLLHLSRSALVCYISLVLLFSKFHYSLSLNYSRALVSFPKGSQFCSNFVDFTEARVTEWGRLLRVRVLHCL